MVNDWKQWLSGTELDRLSLAIGRTGETAKALCPQFRDINITAEAADDVFFEAQFLSITRRCLELSLMLINCRGMSKARCLA
jgi:hypothetical protein